MGRLPLVLALCWALLSSGGTLAPPPPAAAAVPAAAPVEAPAPQPAVRGYTYGRHVQQTVTAYTGNGGPPLVILHGGFWEEDTDWSHWARWFAGRGFTVYDADYRLSSAARWPAQRADVQAVLAWVALRHRGTRPLLLGSSAGGQLATMAGAYGAGGGRVRGVVALSPVASPQRAWRDGARATHRSPQRRLREAARRLAGCAPGRCPARWRDMGVARHASGAEDAPMFLVHSAGDFVPATHSEELVRAERDAGARAEGSHLRVVRGSAHGGVLLDDAGVRGGVLRWLRERG